MKRYCVILALVYACSGSHLLWADDTETEGSHGSGSETEVGEPASEQEVADVSEDEVSLVGAMKTLHRYQLGPIQKQRMLAQIRTNAMRQGLTGQRLATHMRGAKMVIDRVDSETFNITLKAGDKLLFTQEGRTKVMTYRIRGKLVEVQKPDGTYRRFAQFNGNKSTLSLLDPVSGTETVAVLQK